MNELTAAVQRQFELAKGHPARQRAKRRKRRSEGKVGMPSLSVPELRLRDFQEQVISDVYRAISQGATDVAVVAGTGSGKTVLAAWMAVDAAMRGRRVWFMAHLDVLIDQTIREFQWVLQARGHDPDHVAAIHPDMPKRYDAMIQIVAIRTAANRLKKGQIPDECMPGLVLFDESHTTRWHSSANEILEATAVPLRIGLTATPLRTKRTEGFSQYFQRAIIAPSVPELTRRGDLAEMRFKEAFDADLASTIAAHSYDEEEIKLAYDTPDAIALALDLYERHGEGGKTIVFCVDVEHAANVAAAANRRGIVAESIDYKTPRGREEDIYPQKKTRAAIVGAFRQGRIHMLTAVDTLAVGFDVKDVIVGIGLRPTESKALHIQQVGRVRRTAPGKMYGIWLDMTGNCAVHGYGDDEWTEAEVLASVGEPSEFANPFVKDCIECGMEIPAAARVCAHCGAQQPIGDGADKPPPRSFNGGLIETVRPSTLDPNCEGHAKKYYRYLLARAVLQLRRKPGYAYALMTEPKRDYEGQPLRDELGQIIYSNPFAHWAINKHIPYGRSDWTLGAIFSAPDSVQAATDYYQFLLWCYRDDARDVANRRIWHAIECEFYAETVTALRESLQMGDLFAERAAVPASVDIVIGKSIAPAW